MTEPPSSSGVIRRAAGRLASQPALLDCAAGGSQGTIAVVPLLDGDRVAGFEIRCGCGASAVVECVYPSEA